MEAQLKANIGASGIVKLGINTGEKKKNLKATLTLHQNFKWKSSRS